MKPAHRKLVVVAGVVVALFATTAVVVHLPVVQRSAWNRMSAAIEEDTGWRISARGIALRAFPARLRLAGVSAAHGGRTVVSLELLEAHWDWLGISKAPHKLDSLALEGVNIAFDAFPETSAADDGTAVPVSELVEIGELRVRGVGGTGEISGVEFVVEGLNVDGELVSGSGTAGISAQRLQLNRNGRSLDLGTVEIQGKGSQDGLDIERFEIVSAAIGVIGTGEIEFLPALSGRFEVATAVDIAEVAQWWDPNLATGLEPQGRLELEGHVAVNESEGVTLELSHRGQVVQVAGYELEELDLVFEEGEPTLRASHPDWGRISATMTAPGVAELAATLDQAPVDRLLAFTAPHVADVIGQPATLSGEIEASLSFPILPEYLSGRFDLEMKSPLGLFGVRAEGAGLSWQVSELAARAVGASLSARGRLDEDGSIEAEGLLTAPDPHRVADSVARWAPAIQGLEIGGGPLQSRFRVGGLLTAPALSATAEWSDPVINGRSIERVVAEASGGLDRVEWKIDLSLGPRSSLAASGSANPRYGSIEGTWEFEGHSLEELMAVAAVSSDIPLRGRVGATGRFEASGESFLVEAEILAPELAVGGWSIENLGTKIAATSDVIVVSDLAGEAYSGTITGGLTVSLADLSATANGDLRWQDIDLGAIPIELPEAAAGVTSGQLRFDGSLARPGADLEITWFSSETAPLVEEARFSAVLSDGRLSLVSDRIETPLGVPQVEVIAPLGDLPLPEWLWPDAPGGPVRMTADVPGFKSEPLQKLLDLEDIVAVAEADLHVELDWDALAPDRPRAVVEAKSLRVLHPSGNIVAEGPLIVSVNDDRIELNPVVFIGLGSRIEASAVYDSATELVNGRFRARLTPEVAAMMPIPVTLEGPMTLNADFELPADRAMSAKSVRGEVTLDHHGGRMVVRDPPVEIRDLRVVAAIDNGVVEIDDGSAEVNRGRVVLGGGWDPESGQGVVLELEEVTTMVAGILSKWNGELAVEPHADRLAHVSGNLSLVAGLWDERFDVASAVLAGSSTTSAEDEILHDVSLDVTVHGLAGIRVENNLGRFNVDWDQLYVAGTAAVPVLRGEVRIAPGGILSLAGHEVEVRRGIVEFTGNPEIDPLVEIVPEEGTTLFGDQGGVDATELATRGLAQGITSALGFENETLRPAEIAVQTESDPSVRFMVGQRLSRQLALFLAFNLTDVQDQLTMLQYWNIPRLKGLALQAYQETADESAGANVFQRFEWGGSRTLTERPELHRLRLDGEWPISKRGLRRAAGLRRGQPYDPFLLFVGAVRMERMLAEHGYQNARVTGVEEGRETSPTLVFTCDAGDPQPVSFEGDLLPGSLRREVTAMYQRPPLESASFDNMVSEVRREVVAEGFLAPDIAVERRGDAIVVNLRRGERTELSGPFFDGMPIDAVPASFRALATPGALALAVDQPEWAIRVIGRILKNSGFVDAKVADVRMEATEPGRGEVHISVSPGERAIVESVSIVGDDPLGLTTGGAFEIRRGAPLDWPAIDAATREIRRAYVEAGYREARARSSIVGESEGSRSVEIRLHPGRRRTVREIRFVGRRDVAEKVLLKGVTLVPGQILTDEELDRSASQVANFSPVERDTVEVVPVGSSQADVEFGVFEKKRWTVEAGGGWSTERSFGAAFGARDDNLFGRGVGLNLRGSLDSVEKKIFLLGSVPPVPGGRLSFISTIGYSTGDAPDEPELLNQDEKLVSLEASYRLPKNVQVGVYYRWTDTRTYEKIPDEFFPLDISVQVGTVGARTVIENFDYLFDPRRGWGLTSDIGWSGELIGSDLEYLSWLSRFSLASEPFRDATWMQALRIGIAEPLKGMNLDREARFFAGGQASVRGFDLNTVGPLTYGVEGSLVPAGGGALFILNEELRIPIWDPLRLAVFADIGQVWESWREADFGLSLGVGFGVRWSTPIGPLWADVAWPVANVGISSRKPKFYLGIGRPF